MIGFISSTPFENGFPEGTYSSNDNSIIYVQGMSLLTLKFATSGEATVGIHYNTYINNLRIDHFVNLCREATAAGKPFTAQQLANESGYRSYSTFSLAFKQRMGQTVTAWMHETAQ